MFKSRRKQLEAENEQVKSQLKIQEAALIRLGHKHEFVEVKRELLNHKDVVNIGGSSEYNVTRISHSCGKQETKFELGY